MGVSGKPEYKREYNKTWVRYPGSAVNQYFRRMISLHVYTWEMHHGKPVPDGYEVHHIDLDKTNNAIENLLALPESAHRKLHAAERYDVEYLSALAAEGRKHAKAWHSTLEGIAFHSKMGYLTWENAERTMLVCKCCGNEFETYGITAARTRFCSNKCRAKARRDSGVDKVECVCEQCGKLYKVNKYKHSQYCSRQCAGAARRK